MTLDNIRLLRSILNKSLDDLESAYQSRSLQFPALDDPYDKDGEAETLTLHPEIGRTIDLVISASYQLLSTVRHPFLTLADASSAYHLSTCLRVSEKLNIPELLRDAGPKGLDVVEIAAKADIEPSKLARILRVLATHHIFKEVNPNVFANNRVSSYFSTTKSLEEIVSAPESKYSGGSSATAGYIGTFTDEVFKASSYLLEDLEDKETGRKFLATGAALQKAVSTDQVYFAWLENRDNAYRFARYGACIQGTSLWDPPTTILHGYNWPSIQNGGVVVDVGGGLGAPSMILARTYPDLRIVIQDRENVVVQGKEHWGKAYPEGLENDRVSFRGELVASHALAIFLPTTLAHDFFTPQPIVGPSVFLVRTICHDWPDDLVVEILKNLRAAASESTRLVLADYIMPYACIAPDNIPQLDTHLSGPAVPRPLLTNLGKASFNAYFIDMTMEVLLNGQERTLDHQIKLAGQAGWKVVDIKRIVNSQFGYLVAEPTFPVV